MKIKTLLFIITASLTLSTLGQTTESDYQKVRKMTVLADKKRFVLGLPHKDQVKVWRSHFAYVLITEPLNDEQQEYLGRVLEAFETGTLTDDLDQEAKDLFEFELGSRVFNPGAWTSSGSLCTAETQRRRGFEIKPATFSFLRVSASPRLETRRVADCNCGQTSTNWGCSGSCDASNSCTVTPDGCSIFYMYPCNGKCSSSEIE